MDWQPIETAPKDGTVIGAWSAKEPGIVRRVCWGHHLASEGQPMAWCTATKMLAVSNLPTHWMPLPAPPTTTQEPTP